jgi:hypothetical protein
MRITGVWPIVGELVEIEGSEWSTYYRYGPDCWGVRMGEAEEPIYSDDELVELEMLYQAWKSSSP